MEENPNQLGWTRELYGKLLTLMGRNHGSDSKGKGNEHRALTINILWQSLKARNECQFNISRGDSLIVINKALNEWSEYQ